MIVLILNSGTGKRMGEITKKEPKCMTKLCTGETILERQLSQLEKAGIKNVVITTGAFDNEIRDYCKSLGLNLNYEFIKNDLYSSTNYIYSIYLSRHLIDDDILLMHGDIVFDYKVLTEILKKPGSNMAVSGSSRLPLKDFKAVVMDGIITKVGVEYFNNSVAALPLYKLGREHWMTWLVEIIKFCEANLVNCYAEDAFNGLQEPFELIPYDIAELLCLEVDTLEDLAKVNNMLKERVE